MGSVVSYLKDLWDSISFLVALDCAVLFIYMMLKLYSFVSDIFYDLYFYFSERSGKKGGEVMTNGDMIRNMSDEDLADTLFGVYLLSAKSV